MAKPKTHAVDINDIILDERCQPRSILNAEAVQEYADIYKEGEVDLPALEVVGIDHKLVLIDGFHRLAGARQADQSFIRVTVVEECDVGRASWLASAVNQGHGVRRTNADKRQAVTLAINSDIGVEQSSRDIGAHVGVSKSFVSNVRAELEVATVATEKTEPEPEDTPHDDDKTDPDMYHTAAARIKGCYKKVCAILGNEDVVCEALFVALEKAQEREL
jgi:DNA repair exonuclease SbcCD nuclease subunit